MDEPIDWRLVANSMRRENESLRMEIFRMRHVKKFSPPELKKLVNTPEKILMIVYGVSLVIACIELFGQARKQLSNEN